MEKGLLQVFKSHWFIVCGISFFLTGCFNGNLWADQGWRTADRSSVGLSPLPGDEPRAVVQGFFARAYGWRGIFSVHTWIAVKEKNGTDYNVFYVARWGLRHSSSTVVVQTDIPDRKWYGRKPYLLFEFRGDKAEALIPLIKKAVKDYPNAHRYHVWPGPNSNSFTSYILRRVPEIGVDLPPNAIGKDYINDGDLCGITESCTGFQLSLYGLLGLQAGLRDGIEVNVLGLCFGLDVIKPALKFPFVGRVGMSDKKIMK